MSQAVQGVVDKWESHGALESGLGEERQCAERRGQRGGLEVPTEQGRGKVRGCEKVEAARQSNTGETVGSAANPGDLRLVDGKVGGNRAVQTLLGKDLGRIRSIGGGGVSNERVSAGAMRTTAI